MPPFWNMLNPPLWKIPGKEILWEATGIPETICKECPRLMPKTDGLLSIAIQADGLLSITTQAFTALF
jgi:hypothetical protein